MMRPVHIRARGLKLPEEVEDQILERTGKLERFYARITGCRVTVEGPGRHHRRGPCEVTIDLAVPGKEIVISHQSGIGLAETVRDAFDAADRRLEDHVRKSRGYVKSHAPAMEAEEGEEEAEGVPARPPRRRRARSK